MLKIGYRGIKGSYSEHAASNWMKKHDQVQWEAKEYQQFRRMIQDLVNHKLDIVALPVENSTTGLISRTTDLLNDQGVYAIAEKYINLTHALVAVPGTSLTDIKYIYSHPEAISQCREWLDAHPHIETVAFGDTAGSARQVAIENNPEIAAISSRRAGEIYGLELLEDSIQDSRLNTTRFLIFSNQVVENTQANKTSLFITTNHEAGALYGVLGVFNQFDLNLEHLTSRPIVNEPFTYGFFIEIAAGIQEERTQNALAQLKEAANKIQVIGSYEQGTTIN